MGDRDRRARELAEQRFRAVQAAGDTQSASPEFEKAAEAAREKSARLKALREAREAAEKERADAARAKTRRARAAP